MYQKREFIEKTCFWRWSKNHYKSYGSEHYEGCTDINLMGTHLVIGVSSELWTDARKLA